MGKSDTQRGYEAGQKGVKVETSDSPAVRDGKLAGQKDAKNGK